MPFNASYGSETELNTFFYPIAASNPWENEQCSLILAEGINKVSDSKSYSLWETDLDSDHISISALLVFSCIFNEGLLHVLNKRLHQKNGPSYQEANMLEFHPKSNYDFLFWTKNNLAFWWVRYLLKTCKEMRVC